MADLQNKGKELARSHLGPWRAPAGRVHGAGEVPAPLGDEPQGDGASGRPDRGERVVGRQRGREKGALGTGRLERDCTARPTRRDRRNKGERRSAWDEWTALAVHLRGWAHPRAP